MLEIEGARINLVDNVINAYVYIMPLELLWWLMLISMAVVGAESRMCFVR